MQILAVKYHDFTLSVSSALFTHSSVSSHQVHGLLNFLLLPSRILNPIRLAPYCFYLFYDCLNFVTVVIQFQFVHDGVTLSSYTSNSNSSMTLLTLSSFTSLNLHQYITCIENQTWGDVMCIHTLSLTLFTLPMAIALP